MKVAKLHIEHFRGIKETTLLFPDHVVLVGDNNVGKSTVFEALDLVLGPDRLSRRPKIDEHDFYNGGYLSGKDGPRKEVKVEVIVAGDNEEQRNRFVDYVEWWDTAKNELLNKPPVGDADKPTMKPAIRVTFVGYYDPEEDDFAGDTYFSRSLVENETPVPFQKRDKQICGFLFLRTLRTGTRAVSLEHGSLLDLILRLK
jgi:putative ATP-dependent endonuclease of OLD family